MTRAPLAALLLASLLAACGVPVVGGRLDAPAPDVTNDLAPPDVPVGADAAPDAPPDALPDDAPDAPAPDAPEDSALDAPDVPTDTLPPGACRADADCAASAEGAVCDPATMRCVQCTAARDQCPTGQYCAGTRCEAGCRDDDACAALAMSGGDAGAPADATPDGGDAARPPSLRCAPTTRTCVECLTDAHCSAGSLCAGNVCVPGCSAERACPAGLTCCTGACIDVQTNTAHCGTCGAACAGANAVPACLAGACTISMCVAPFDDCDGTAANGCEVDTRASLAHCGACNRACAARPNATAACDAGACRYTCAEAYADCDGDPTNGCEADTRVSPSHCGACGRRCDAPNGVAACRAGACAVERCNDAFGDCDGDVTNGCETPLTTAPAHCGMCGRGCATRPNAPPACAMGACATVCASGFADCDGTADTGCEADLRASAEHCGACGRACRPASGTGACVAGSCTVRSCDAGRADCDMNAANGCETDTTRDLGACGACGAACPARAGATATCVAGACGFTCATGLGDCNRDAADGCETDTRVTAAHCGGCGSPCAARANATATCAASACAYACNAGFADCDRSAANGCEVDLRTNGGHCGACDVVCRVAGGAGVCVAGSCSVSACDPGRGDCDMNAANGCETDVASNVRACGACGTVCPARAGAAATCAMGSCGFTCNAGLGDCNRDASDGCETDTRAAVAHCGGCAMPCAARPNTVASCAAGACQYACVTGFADCDGNAANGCETDTRTSLPHCGACNRACTITSGTGVCAGGTCQVARCDAGRADCDGSAANGCEVATATDPRACGACGVVCPARPSATVTCSGGACGFACVAGFADCNGAAGDGCEVDARSSTAHCGGCGRLCAARPNASVTCASGACSYACNAGFSDCDGNPANGCETDTRSNPAACGACGRSCSVSNGSAGCSSGACTVATCNAGFGNCDGNPANGCEVAHDTNSSHCGACSRACPGGQSCYAGRCSVSCGDTRPVAPSGCTNIAPSGGAFASSSSAAPPFANDGNLCTAWNAGNYAPRWWAVDLGAVRTFRGVTLVAEMLPNGAVAHEIQVSNNGSTFTTARAVSQTMANSGLYTFDLGSATGRYVRILSNSSPSWIAWREVSVYTCP